MTETNDPQLQIQLVRDRAVATTADLLKFCLLRSNVGREPYMMFQLEDPMPLNCGDAASSWIQTVPNKMYAGYVPRLSYSSQPKDWDKGEFAIDNPFFSSRAALRTLNRRNRPE